MLILVLDRQLYHMKQLNKHLDCFLVWGLLLQADILFSRKIISCQEKTGKVGQEVMYSYKCFNSDYMEFVGYETYEKLIWASSKGCINKNTISKQGIPIINMNMTFPS